jgi:hypothetical protein
MNGIVLSMPSACLHCFALWQRSQANRRRARRSALFPLPSAFQGTGLVAALVIMVVVALVTVRGPGTPSCRRPVCADRLRHSIKVSGPAARHFSTLHRVGIRLRAADGPVHRHRPARLRAPGLRRGRHLVAGAARRPAQAGRPARVLPQGIRLPGLGPGAGAVRHCFAPSLARLLPTAALRVTVVYLPGSSPLTGGACGGPRA